MTTRALGLVRVSKERDGLVSPEIQRTAITDLCERQGYRLAGWLEGLDQSGSQRRSAWWPTLERAVGMVEAGEVDVLVLWKFSRAARDRLRWAVALDRVETAGGHLESATEQFDTRTSSGRFARGMLAELNAFEAERIGEVWRDVQGNRVAQGLTHNGRRRFGYTYADGLHRPDPATGPVLADLYRRYVAGESVYGLARDLNLRGIRTTAGGLWSDRTMRRVLDSGFAAGFVPYDGTLHPGVHEPLVDADTWAAYLEAKRARARVAPRSQRSPYLLSGLLRCGHCEGAMTAGTFGKGRIPKYRCEAKRSTAGAACAEGGFVSAARVHDAVFAWLRSLAGDLDDAAADAAQGAAVALDTSTADAERIAREVTRLEVALVRLAQQHAEDAGSDEAVYRAARDDYRQRLEAARAQHEALVDRAHRLEVAPAAIARPLVDDWHTLGVEGRREVLRRLVARVQVWKTPRGTDPRVRVVPLWESAA